ncbi:MAG: ATP-binding cassette domain-containing protein [Treponema sp.]|nr:ATP-binding cassette domain-containing protein [Treponema sp.]
MAEYAVELRGISKVYPGSEKKANHNISLGLRSGEILCIAGENGAGKTTLMKILAGIETPSVGEIYIRQNKVNIASPLDARRLGIGMVHQRFMLFPEYTAAENIVMGIEPRKWGIFCDTAGAGAAAAQLIAAHHFSIKPDQPVHGLSVGEMQQVEICRTLYRNADIIILDEPSAALTEQETSSLFKTLKALALTGKSLILITHKLTEIKRISDRVAVLRRGELAGVRNTADIDEYEIYLMMAGAETSAENPALRGAEGVSAAFPRHSPYGFTPLRETPAAAHSGPVIAFDTVTVLRRGQKRPLLDRVSFSVAEGEILGFAGVGGNGLGVLEAALGGFLHPSSGKILHRGRDISRLNIRRLRNQGLAYVPADRLRVGSALGASVDENVMIDRRGEFTRLSFLKRRTIRDFSQELIRRYRITGAGKSGALSSGAEIAASLSGGNLQKLILAREIEQMRDYIVFSEPTWGLDIAARDFVHGEIAGLRKKGAAVILISTDLDEILGLADRIIVMYRGKAAGELVNTGKAVIKEEIGAGMRGLSYTGGERG